MMGMTNEQVLEFNNGVIAEFRENDGVCGGHFEGNPLLLLTVTGRTSGRKLTCPLTHHTFQGNPVVMASAGGDPKPPSWYWNLTANDQVEIEIGTDKYAATAIETEGDERTEALASMVAAMPRFGEYGEKAGRDIPVIKLVKNS